MSIKGVDEVLIVTGMSGAGRSTAAGVLGDLGWFVIDNLPPALLTEALTEISNDSTANRVAIVIDAKWSNLFAAVETALTRVVDSGASLKILFLDSGDETLVRRYESSRRPHPFDDGSGLLQGVAKERLQLGDLRAKADLVIDTTELNPAELRARIESAFAEADQLRLRASIQSFGFKYGVPLDSDLVFDARFLPNPYWRDDLRPLSGMNESVVDFVMAQDGAKDFIEKVTRLLSLMSQGYLREGKRYVTVAIGCTGGYHRSVALASKLHEALQVEGISAIVTHRDMNRGVY
jgi:UPF0042 nucleotide-binding protein